MKLTALIAAVLVSGCAYNLTLYPRGGGEPIKGVLDSASRTMTVAIRGETYTGDYVMGSSVSVGTFNTLGRKPTFGTGVVTTAGNDRSALLISGNKTLRCEFVVQMTGGNGTCIGSDEQAYDLLVSMQ